MARRMRFRKLWVPVGQCLFFAAVLAAVFVLGMASSAVADVLYVGELYGDTGGVTKWIVEPNSPAVADPVFEPVVAPKATVALGSDGILYVRAQDLGTVTRYDSTTGVPLDEEAWATNIGTPTGLTSGPDDALYVGTWQDSPDVWRIPFSAPPAVPEPYVDVDTQYSNANLMFGPDDELYMCDANKITKFDGSSVTYFASVDSQGICLSPDGSTLFATVFWENQVRTFDLATGSLLENAFLSTPTTGMLTTGLAFGPDQNNDGQSDLYVQTFTDKTQTGTVMVYDGLNGNLINDSYIDELYGPMNMVFATSVVPEPSALALLAAGLLAIAVLRRR